MKYWQVQWTVPAEAAEAVAALAQEWPGVGGVVVEGAVPPDPPHPEWGEWFDDGLLRVPVQQVRVYVPQTESWEDVQERAWAVLERVSAAALPTTDADVAVTAVDEQDWADAWKKEYRPLPVGRGLVIIPLWEREAAGRWPDRTPVYLEPGMAFGTGTHGTTTLCLEVLEEAVRLGSEVLDVGCGTAILGIAAAKLGASRVLALDIDPVAVDVARDNVRQNDVADRVEVRQGDLLSGLEPSDAFDVIVANILRDIVIRLIPQAAPRLRSGGRVILSGFVSGQAPQVEAAMTAAGLVVVERRMLDDWVALVGEKRP